VLVLRYALTGERSHTLDETSRTIGVTRERVLLIDSHAQRTHETSFTACSASWYSARAARADDRQHHAPQWSVSSRFARTPASSALDPTSVR
jgi:hypothetical protein